MALTAALIAVVLSTTACGFAARLPDTTAPATTTTTTPARPPADPIAWAKAYCGGYALMLKPAAELAAQVNATPAAIKTAVVNFETTSVISLRFTATELEKLGALGPDVERLNERLVVALRKSADKHDAVGARVGTLPADAKFWTTYQQFKAQEFTEVADDEVDSLATDIGRKYPAPFDNEVCAEVKAAAK